MPPVPPVPSTRDHRRLLDVALEAALAGAGAVRTGEPGGGAETKSSPGDYVTDADRRSEAAIVSVLRETAPDIPVLGEEGGMAAGSGRGRGAGGLPGDAPERCWVVDPLDGTTNFIHRFPVVGISVALLEQGLPAVGVVHAPFLGQTYQAVRGAGAEVRRGDGSRAPLRVSDRPAERAVVGTGFPFRRKEVVPRYVDVFRRALERFEDLRRPGAASLDLAWTAAGVFDGFFELGLSAWDVAAGALLIEEAGGVVTDWEGGPGYLAGDILAGSPAVHAALLEMVRDPFCPGMPPRAR